MGKILKLATTDFKLIFRDPTLRSFLFLPVLLFVLMVWAVPPLVDRYEFLIPYLPVFLVVAIIENTQLFCFVSTIVLIEEKEIDVAKVYGVVPLSNLEYIISRFILPYFFTVLLNVVMFVVQPLYAVSIGNILVISLLAALVVPAYVLAIGAMVQNKMQGMVYVKAFNMLVLIPVAAFFVPEKFIDLFGIFPTHWIFQSVDYVTKGLPIFWMAGVGFIFLMSLIWFSSKLFIRRHFV